MATKKHGIVKNVNNFWESTNHSITTNPFSSSDKIFL